MSLRAKDLAAEGPTSKDPTSQTPKIKALALTSGEPAGIGPDIALAAWLRRKELEAAEARANELAQQGIAVGILDSNQYPTLEPNKFVVFSGQYDTERAANQGLAGLTGQVEGAYVRHVSPTASSSSTTTPTPTTSPTP